jgi:peptide/nickel transport system permease protein
MSTIDTPTTPAPVAPGAGEGGGIGTVIWTNPWCRFVLRRLIGLVLILIGLVIATFLMVQLIPGDPVTNALGLDVPPAQLEAIRKQLGLDDPLYLQFWHYVSGLVHGDMGQSFYNSQPVADLIQERIGTSLELALAAILPVLVCGTAIGMIAAALTREGRHRRFELGFTAVTSVVGTVPDYLMGTILAFLFAVQFRLLPVAGAGSFKTLILPALAVGLHSTATLARIVRVETLNVMQQLYIRTARSDRLPAWIIYGRHALPNALTAALTIGGLIFASVLGGTVVVENVFARPGLGTALVHAVIVKDYPIIQGITLVLGITVVTINMLVDVVLALLDPRSLARHA